METPFFLVMERLVRLRLAVPERKHIKHSCRGAAKQNDEVQRLFSGHVILLALVGAADSWNIHFLISVPCVGNAIEQLNLSVA